MTNRWERTNLRTDAYFAGTNFRRKLAFNSPAFKYTIRRETGMPCSRSSNIQRSRGIPTHSRKEGRPLWVEAAFGFDFLVLIFGDSIAWLEMFERHDPCKLTWGNDQDLDAPQHPSLSPVCCGRIQSSVGLWQWFSSMRLFIDASVHVCSCICAKDGLYLCQSCAPVLVFVPKTGESWRTWRSSSEVLVDVLQGGADACTPPLKMMNSWGVQESTNYGRARIYELLVSLVDHLPEVRGLFSFSRSISLTCSA